MAGVSPAIPAPFNVATFNREFTAQAFDTLATDQTNQTNKEDAN